MSQRDESLWNQDVLQFVLQVIADPKTVHWRETQEACIKPTNQSSGPEKTVSHSRVDSCGSEPLLLKDRAAVKDTELSGPGGLKTKLRTETKSWVQMLDLSKTPTTC